MTAPFRLISYEGNEQKGNEAEEDQKGEGKTGK